MEKGIQRLGEKLGYVKAYGFKKHEQPFAGRKRLDIPQKMLDNIDFGPGCWEWTGNRTPAGYGVVTSEYTYRGCHTVYAHREMYRLWYWEEPPNGREFHVMHSCDNPGCVRPDHLSLGTAKQNHDDAIAKGRK